MIALIVASIIFGIALNKSKENTFLYSGSLLFIQLTNSPTNRPNYRNYYVIKNIYIIKIHFAHPLLKL